MSPQGRRPSQLAIGDRVSTPEGDGTIVGWSQVDMRLGWPPLYRPYVQVELDNGRGVQSFPAGQLEPFSSKAENQAEALEVERHQEAKHGEM